MAKFGDICMFSFLFIYRMTFVMTQGGTTVASGQTQQTSTLPLTDGGSNENFPPTSNQWPSSPISTSTDIFTAPSAAPTAPSVESTALSVEPTALSGTQTLPPSSEAPTADSGNSRCSNVLTIERCWGYLEEKGGENLVSSFNQNTTIEDILGLIIKKDIMEALMAECEPGQWCLSYTYHERIYAGITSFYQSPICSVPLWNCLQMLAEYREGCMNNGDLYALMEMISLMCDLNALGDLQTECYTQAIQILHVLFTDAYRGFHLDLRGPLCANYTKQIVKTFMCSIRACGVKQTVFLKEFNPLVNVALNSEMVFVKCTLDTLCPDNSTLAPRLETSVVLNTTNATNPVPSNSSELVQKILSEEEAEQDALDHVFNELEHELEEEERKTFEGKTEKPSISTETDTGTGGSTGGTEGGPGGGTWVGDDAFGNGEISGPDETNDSSFGMNGDQTMLFGTITLSILVLLGLISIGLMSCRHYRKRAAGYKRGYSQLTDEESRMLNNYE